MTDGQDDKKKGKQPVGPEPRVEAAYNPLDKVHLAESVEGALLARDVIPFASLTPFIGAGVYAIYYTGKLPIYGPLVRRNAGAFDVPIYVGKAVPSGARKGLSVKVGKDIYRRLNEHRASIEQVPELNVKDFYCRYLVVDDIWIPLGESLLIEKFEPIWNGALDGFGNHNPGKGRYKGKRPLWDVVHHGRAWVMKCEPNPKSRDEILEDLARYWEARGMK